MDGGLPKAPSACHGTRLTDRRDDDLAFNTARARMTDEPGPQPSQLRQALKVWAQLLGLLVALSAFCWIIFRLRASLH